MKISYIEIRNFRGINHAELCDLKSTVVIAGPNGCGKSAILDAIRLIKSAYGGYQPNEWQQWMGEFQINMAIASDMNRILHNRERDAQIKCDFMLDPNERAFLRTHARDLLEDMVWPQILPNIPSGPAGRIVRSMEPWNQRKAEVDEVVEKLYPELNLELNARSIKAMLGFGPNKTMQTARSVVLALMFSTYKPGVLGVIDYHGPQRHFSRESVQGVNLDLSAVEQQRVQSALYNYGNKYTNIKTEMAASYLHDMLAEKAGRGEPVDPSLATTMQELFKTFFPDKEFLGPRPTVGGLLEFPVKLKSGSTHDLNELSAGEKEILFGYLRIRSSAPRYSIILLDEPELHLNPRLVKNLPDFYHKHLAADYVRISV